MNSGYRIKLTKKAMKYLEKLDLRSKKRVESVISLLKEDPYSIPNTKPLQGTSQNQFRVRIGDLRMIYQIIDQDLIVIVMNIGPRGDIYK